MKIALIYNYSVPSTTGAYVEKVMQDAKLAYQRFGVTDPSTIPSDFDLYLRIDHGDYQFNISEKLHPAVFWAIDTHLKKPYKKICRQVRHYDIVFCAQKEGALRLARETRVDCRWLPLACDPQVHRRLDIPRRYDIAFVGRNAAKFDRGRHLTMLAKKYPNSFIGLTEYTRMAEVYSAAKIGFNSSIVNDINMRVFEVLSCGAMLLTNRIRDNGFDELFEEGKHLVTYRNDRNLLELIDYYLAHDEERERIARQGHTHAIAKHTYFHRVQALFNYIAFRFGGEYNTLRI